MLFGAGQRLDVKGPQHHVQRTSTVDLLPNQKERVEFVSVVPHNLSTTQVASFFSHVRYRPHPVVTLPLRPTVELELLLRTRRDCEGWSFVAPRLEGQGNRLNTCSFQDDPFGSTVDVLGTQDNTVLLGRLERRK